jgi:hypothetical protein
MAVLYAMNELVPSTLIVMPIFWFQQKIISEERSSSLAQAQVHKLQRRQDELLDALLPPAIVGRCLCRWLCVCVLVLFVVCAGATGTGLTAASRRLHGMCGHP